MPLKEVPLHKITNRVGFNPRKDIDVKDINRLAASIKEVGLITPITVRPDKAGYVIVSGHRRFMACEQLKCESIPCQVLHDGEDELAKAIVANIHQRDMTLAEQATAVKRLREQGYTTRTSIAKRLGIPESRVKDLDHILYIPVECHEFIGNQFPQKLVPLLHEVSKQSERAAKNLCLQVVHWNLNSQEVLDDPFLYCQPVNQADGFIEIYVKGESVSLSTFAWDDEYQEVVDQVTKDLKQVSVHFLWSDEHMEYARSLKATVDIGDNSAFFDVDIATDIAKKELAKIVKELATSLDWTSSPEGQPEFSKKSPEENGGSEEPKEDNGSAKQKKDQKDLKKAEKELRDAEYHSAQAFNETLAKQLGERVANAPFNLKFARGLVAMALSQGNDLALSGIRYTNPRFRKPGANGGKDYYAGNATKSDVNPPLSKLLDQAKNVEELLAIFAQIVTASRCADARVVSPSNQTGESPFATERSPKFAQKAIDEMIAQFEGKLTPGFKKEVEVRRKAQAPR